MISHTQMGYQSDTTEHDRQADVVSQDHTTKDVLVPSDDSGVNTREATYKRLREEILRHWLARSEATHVNSARSFAEQVHPTELSALVPPPFDRDLPRRLGVVAHGVIVIEDEQPVVRMYAMVEDDSMLCGMSGRYVDAANARELADIARYVIDVAGGSYTNGCWYTCPNWLSELIAIA